MLDPTTEKQRESQTERQTAKLGLFVAFEGIDGSGKTEQIDRVAEELRIHGKKVFTTRAPNTVFAQLHVSSTVDPSWATHRQYELACLFVYDHLRHWREKIHPALLTHDVVLCDRYIMSTVAYQSLLLPFYWLLSVANPVSSPDLSIVFDLPVKEAQKRIKQRSKIIDSFEVPEQQEHSAQTYKKLIAMPDWGRCGGYARTINADQSIEKCTEEITAIVLQTLAEAPSDS